MINPSLIHKQSQKEWELDAHWYRFYMNKQALASLSMEEEEDEECDYDWYIEEHLGRGWEFCWDCLYVGFGRNVEEVVTQDFGVNDSEKIEKHDELTNLVKEASKNMDDKEFCAYWDSLHQKQPLASSPMEEWDNAWSLEEYARRGWTAIIINGIEKIVSEDELTKMIEEASGKNMEAKEFYAYLDGLYGWPPLAPEECDNALSPDELVGLAINTSSRRKKKKNKRKKETPSLWTFKLLTRRVTKMRSKRIFLS